jgi:hypothetical protein
MSLDDIVVSGWHNSELISEEAGSGTIVLDILSGQTDWDLLLGELVLVIPSGTTSSGTTYSRGRVINA